ncbi:hypothetical protein HUJ05_000504 [Dendroctonus ponderosae]|nr:hypothetical protein HUJ05_000504 [Dendroctonus ponderosae]
MLGIKYLFAIILLFLSVWNVATFVEYPSVNFNFSQPNKNVVITDANENLIFQKAKSKNRLSKINFTGATVNDGKMPEQKATPVAKRIKSEKNKFKTDQTTSPYLIRQIIAEKSNKEIAREIRSSPNEPNITATKVRNPIKLNMKQGLIMNQILNTYGLSDVNNSLCRDHVNEFKLGLRAMEPWALKMFDASSKLMPGILAGNLAELGAWQQCLDINEETSFGPIKGRHCMLFIYPNEKLVKIILDFKKKISEKVCSDSGYGLRCF